MRDGHLVFERTGLMTKIMDQAGQARLNLHAASPPPGGCRAGAMDGQNYLLPLGLCPGRSSEGGRPGWPRDCQKASLLGFNWFARLSRCCSSRVLGDCFDMMASLERLRTLPRLTTVAYADAEAARRRSIRWRANGVFRGGTESDSTPRAFQLPDRPSRPDARWPWRGSLLRPWPSGRAEPERVRLVGLRAPTERDTWYSASKSVPRPPNPLFMLPSPDVLAKTRGMASVSRLRRRPGATAP